MVIVWQEKAVASFALVRSCQGLQKKKNRQISKGKKSEEKKRPDKNQKKGKWMQSVSLHHSPRNILGKKYTLVGYKEFPGTSSTYQAPGRVFADNLLAFRFLVVCFLYKTSPNPRKITCCGIWCALNATFWPNFSWVGFALGWGRRRFRSKM